MDLLTRCLRRIVLSSATSTSYRLALLRAICQHDFLMKRAQVSEVAGITYHCVSSMAAEVAPLQNVTSDTNSAQAALIDVQDALHAWHSGAPGVASAVTRR